MRKASMSCACVAAFNLMGCNVNSPTYFAPPAGPLEVGVADSMGAVSDSASAAIVLPFRSPSDRESAGLADEAARLGFKAPWLRRDGVAISIQWTITNLAAEPGEARIVVNGANEFSSYDPEAIAAAQEMAAMMMMMVAKKDYVLSLIEGKPAIIEANGTLTGTIREDDFAEAELDLDAIGRWMAPAPAVLINASEVNPVGLEQVPAGVIVPALYQVVITLKATTHMKLDFLVRVRDEKGHLLQGSNGSAFAPAPVAYVPAPEAMMN
jgi:hypothetical protein